MALREGKTLLKSIKMEMKKTKGIKGLGIFERTSSRRPLIENNNNDEIKDDYTSHDNTVTQNASNAHEERRRQSEEQIPPRLTPQQLARLLDVSLDALTSEDGEQQPAVCIIQRYVSQHFPKTPADVDQNLYRHLLNVQQVVCMDLQKWGPVLQSEGLIECYHRHTLEHLDDLLQNISSPKNSFVLTEWLLQTYLSEDLFGNPDFQDMDPIKKIDLELYNDLASRAEDNLLKNVQTEISRLLENILQNEKSHEAHDELYVDVIQCINAMLTQALRISLKLSRQVQEVCFQELWLFLTKYAAEQSDILREKAKMDKSETSLQHFLKTLKNCKELKQYVQTKAGDIEKSPLQELMTKAVATLENMEAFTLKLLMKIVADIAERHLKKYFKSENREFFNLLDEVKTLFSDLSHYQDVRTRVMDEAYELIAHIYLKHLIKIRLSKLRKSWHPDVGQTVAEDAEMLHDIISELAPGVDQRNRMLLKVKELVENESLEVTKITVAEMYEQCDASSEDLDLLPALLQWKGLSGKEIREVQCVLEILPGFQPKARCPPWYSCFICCCTRGSTVAEVFL